MQPFPIGLCAGDNGGKTWSLFKVVYRAESLLAGPYGCHEPFVLPTKGGVQICYAGAPPCEEAKCNSMPAAFAQWPAST